MIDSRIIKMLASPNAENRRKAIKALAQTKDQAALPYLAKVYRDDADKEIRELARKAGIYIKNNAPPPEPEPEPAYDEYDYDDDEYDEYDIDSRLGGTGGYSLYDEPEDEEDVEEDATPLPSEIVVSKMDESRARGYLDQVMDVSVRGDNAKAVDLIQRALRLDPRLIHNSYTMSLAASVTGLSGDEAIKRLAPSASELEKKKRKSSSQSATGAPAGGTQGVLAALLAFSALVVLVAYFIMPWIDMAQVETIDATTGQVVTLGESLELAQEQFDALLTLAGSSEEIPPEFQQIIDSFDSLKLSLNGVDTTLVSIGQQNVLEAMGFMDFLEGFIGLLGGFVGDSEQAQIDAAMAEFNATLPEPTPLDYTLPLVPLAALLALVLGVLLLRRGKISTWLIAVVVGLIGVGPMIYFYLSGIEAALPQADTVALEAVGTLDIPTATDLLGMGYWLALVAMLAVVIIPFVALLLTPAPEQAAA